MSHENLVSPEPFDPEADLAYAENRFYEAENKLVPYAAMSHGKTTDQLH